MHESGVDDTVLSAGAGAGDDNDRRPTTTNWMRGGYVKSCTTQREMDERRFLFLYYSLYRELYLCRTVLHVHRELCTSAFVIVKARSYPRVWIGKP